jgi:uncharacterized protein YegL
MPTFDKSDDLEDFGKLPLSHFGFSATKPEFLDASEYTLVTIVQDNSGSVDHFRNEMEATLKAIVEACQSSPRKDNHMVRLCTFDSRFTEVHGFKRLQQIKPADYDGLLGGGGATALFDASCNAVEASNVYGKKLTENEFDVNAIVFFITDGWDNASTVSTHQVRDALQAATKEEYLESIVSVLIGVNQTTDISAKLDEFKTEAGITQHVGIADANPKSLAKLAEFVSKSVSAQSQALGTGGPSQSLAF